MVIEKGEKVHVIVRRNFETDIHRHFIGEILEVSGTIVRAEGYVYVLNTGTNQYTRRPDKRIRIIGLSEAGNIVNILPSEAILGNVKYTQSEDKRLIFTDGKTFCLDINEFGITR